MNPTDRRVRKTKQQLRSSLSKLLKDKAINKITISEISELSDINRGTFYLHYRDMYDLLDQIEKEMLDELQETIKPHLSRPITPKEILTDVFAFLARNADMALPLIGQYGDFDFVSHIRSMIHTALFQFARSFDWEHRYFHIYVEWGLTGLFEEWLKSGMKQAPPEMAALAEKIMTFGEHSWQRTV
jgi:AcrR family transcriptional regulator